MTRMPMQHEPLWRRALRAWFDPRGHDLGLIAFALNRLSGIGLTAYLLLHLVVLTTFLRGESAWQGFVTLAKSPLFVAMDAVLILGMIIHGLNGIRVTLIGLGFGARHQKTMFTAVMAVGLVVFLVAMYLIVFVK